MVAAPAPAPAMAPAPRLINYTGRECVGLVGEALPVRPTAAVNASRAETAAVAAWAESVPEFVPA